MWLFANVERGMLRGDIETTVLGSGSPRQVYLKTQRKSPVRAVFYLQL